MPIDLLKNSDDSDTEEKKHALQYLEEALSKKDKFIKTVIDGIAGDEIEKDPLIAKIKDAFFDSYKLRMAITGRKLKVEEDKA